MNFLQLAQMVKRESGLSGGPVVSVATASGDDARIFAWVNSAWQDLFLGHESWRFRRGEALGETTTATMAATTVAPGFALTDFASWKQSAGDYKPTAWRTADGQVTERELYFLDYESYRRRFTVGVHTPGPVRFWTVSPDEALLLGPTPDAAHMVRASYVKDFIPLALDADEPTLPARFHDMIAWRALREYGGYDAASEVYQRADQNYRDGWSALAQSQLQMPGFGARPLAGGAGGYTSWT